MLTQFLSRKCTLTRNKNKGEKKNAKSYVIESNGGFGNLTEEKGK